MNVGTETRKSRLPSDIASRGDSRSQVPCQFFFRGACLKDDKCPFSHAGLKDVAEPVVEAEVALSDALTDIHSQSLTGDQEDSGSETWRRELRGALVNFGDGAVVTKASLPSDFSAVRISHLPPETTPSSVVDLLASLGFTVPEDCVRILPLAENTYCNASVRVEDSQFAKRLCGLLATKRHGAFEAAPIHAPIPQAANCRRVDSKKVHCSWHKPTNTAWLNFGNGDIAARVSSKFSRGIYKVLGQRVECEEPTRGAGDRNGLAWTIRLSGVPKLASKEHVICDINTTLLPRHIELSPASHDIDLLKANTLIKSLLVQTGPLEWWEGSAETTGKRFKAKARFINDADARQTVTLYNDKPLPLLNTGKLTVQLVHSARLKASTRVYEAVEQEIADHKQVWNSQHLVFIAYPPAQGFRVLKIEGEVSKDVANAKATLEKILDGEVMMKNGEAIWTTSFATNGRAHQKMKLLERELGIVIVRDKRRSQLRLLGHRSRFEEAQHALIELAKEDFSSVFVINLDTREFSWAFKGGCRAIAAVIGADKVTLDIVSNPRRILVMGSEADFNAAREILRDRDRVSRAESEAISISDCAICWTEAENPVHTLCKHVYCAGCFEDLCVAGASIVDSDPYIRCQGNAGTCGERLQLTELQQHLSTAVLEDVLEAAFTAYITRHPNDLRYCPTPDCGQIYRIADPSGRGDGPAGTSQSLLFTCPVCFVAVCTTCHASHDGLTCAEHRDHASGGYKALQDLKKKLDIKDCPKCGTMIEKTFGCNHMTCSACKTHICWVCLKTFPVGDPVYAHMTREHGGIGVDYFPGMV